MKDAGAETKEVSISTLLMFTDVYPLSEVIQC